MTGEFCYHHAFTSCHLAQPRDVIVYLPPGYRESGQHYPVLYMQDGQNLFDPATAFYNQSWQMSEVMDPLIRSRQIAPLLIVGVYNTGETRIDEYTPTRDQRMGRGGLARLYGRMLVDHLKPMIDATYRTLPERERTGLGGSSLGGLVTLAVGLRYPTMFGKLAVMSPSVWWDRRVILTTVARTHRQLRPHIWLDMGTHEGNRPELTLHEARILRNALLRRGWQLGTTLAYWEAEGAGHNEQAWHDRLAPMLRYLFPPEK